MLPRPRLVCQEPGLRPISRSPGVPDKSSRGLGSMSRYSAQILICILRESIPRGCLMRGGWGWGMGGPIYDHLLCPSLQPGPPSQTPGGLGQRCWSMSGVTWPPNVTSESGVSEVGVFRVLQPNIETENRLRSFQSIPANQLNAMASEILAHCVARPSTTILIR